MKSVVNFLGMSYVAQKLKQGFIKNKIGRVVKLFVFP